MIRAAAVLLLLVPDVLPTSGSPFTPSSVGLVRTLAPKVGAPTCVALSADGGRLVIGGGDGSLVLHAAPAWRVVARSPMESGDVVAAAFRPDGARIAAAHVDGNVRTWNAKDLKPVGAWPAGTELSALAWAPDGATLYLGGDEGHLVRVDAATGALVRKFDAGEGWVLGLAVSADGSRLAAARADGVVKVYDAAGGAEVARFAGASDSSGGVAFSPDGRKLAFAMPGKLAAVGDLSTGGVDSGYAGHADEVTDVAWTPDGRHLLTASADCSIWMWKGRAVAARLKHHTGGLIRIAVSRNGRVLASVAEDYQVKVWGAVPGGTTRLKPKGYLGVMVDTDAGACRVTQVIAGHAAEKAGIVAGEVLESIAGERVASREEAVQQIGLWHEGDEVEVGVVDAKGVRRALKIKLGPRPPQ